MQTLQSDKTSMPYHEEVVKVFAIERHRIGIDGEGITTLVTLHGCPLHCKYCMNPECNDTRCKVKGMTANDVVKLCMCDNLYFLATGGGITVGGGEPLLHPDFVHQLRKSMPHEWKMNVETSLNVPTENVRKIIRDASLFIIDVKDTNSDIYMRYTSRSNELVMRNLSLIAETGLQDKCLLRLPLIRDYNTFDDIYKSKGILQGMGFSRFDEFEYSIV